MFGILENVHLHEADITVLFFFHEEYHKTINHNVSSLRSCEHYIIYSKLFK